MNENPLEPYVAPLPAVQAPTSFDSLLQIAVERGVPVDTMERLMVMRRELKTEKSQADFFAALSAFQAECPKIKKSKGVMNKGTLRYFYAPLEDIIEQVAPLLQKYGFSHTEDAVCEEGWVTGTCLVHHIGGYSRPSAFKVPVDYDSYMNLPQKFASAFTFAKRYAFCAAFGIMTGDHDDDANEVAEPAKGAPAKRGLPKASDVKPAVRRKAMSAFDKEARDAKKEHAEQFYNFLEACRDSILKKIEPADEWLWHAYAVRVGWILPTEVLRDAPAQAMFPTIVVSGTREQNVAQAKNEVAGHRAAVVAMRDNMTQEQEESALRVFGTAQTEPDPKANACPFCEHAIVSKSEKYDGVNVCGFCYSQWVTGISLPVKWEEHPWQYVICPIPPPGVKKSEYDPMTLGQVMRADNRRAYGIIMNFEAKGYDGAEPSEVDIAFAGACAEAQKHFAEKPTGREAEPNAGPEGA